MISYCGDPIHRLMVFYRICYSAIMDYRIVVFRYSVLLCNRIEYYLYKLFSFGFYIPNNLVNSRSVWLINQVFPESSFLSSWAACISKSPKLGKLTGIVWADPLSNSLEVLFSLEKLLIVLRSEVVKVLLNMNNNMRASGRIQQL